VRYWFPVALLSVIIAWEGWKIFIQLRLGTSVLFKKVYEKSRSPKTYWTLVTTHAVLLGFIVLIAIFLASA
jgi:hypothetical protein